MNKVVAFDDFFERSSIGAKTAVLLANETQASALRSVEGIEQLGIACKEELKELAAAQTDFSKSVHRTAFDNNILGVVIIYFCIYAETPLPRSLSMSDLFGIRLLPLFVALALTGISVSSSSRAQTYPIDCAILLCLSGGWPASVPCTRARAEFIRRISPWPVEPPLQIWRCPMGASYETRPNTVDRIFKALYQTGGRRPMQSLPGIDLVPADHVLRLVQDRADIDISGPEFNFVRSIRVFDVRYARQNRTGSEGNCQRSADVVVGTYGAQGEFSWRRSSPIAVPDAHVGLENWGHDCPRMSHRSVFVDWRDSQGQYGFEQVDY